VTWANRAWGKALLETVKYSVKPAEILKWKEPAGPLIDEMAHAKLVTAFGSCHGMKAKWDEEDAVETPGAVCDNCNAVSSMLSAEALRFVNPGYSQCHWSPGATSRSAGNLARS
jgi:hypothetical protein